MNYWLHIIVLFGIYAALASSLNLAAGQLGLFSVAHAGLFGIGAYTGAILELHGASLALGIPAAMVCAASAAIPLAVAASRLRADQFVVATLAYQALLTSIFENWSQVTGGPLGLANIPQRLVGVWTIDSVEQFGVLALVLGMITIFTVSRLSSGAFGRLLHCVRDEPALALSLGKRVSRTQLQVLAISGAFAGAAGAIYASYVTFIDPSSFTLDESIAIATMAIAGGLRSRWGPVIGAAALVLLPELLRFAGLPGEAAASLNRIIFGGALVWIVLSRPQGLIGRPAGQEAAMTDG